MSRDGIARDKTIKKHYPSQTSTNKTLHFKLPCKQHHPYCTQEHQATSPSRLALSRWGGGPTP